METPKTVLLVDLSAIFRAAWHANADGPMSVSYQATLDGVRRCVAMAGGADVLTAVCCDARGNWRKALSPSYKEHREKQPEAMYGILDRVKTKLREDGFLLWECDGYEADDLLAGGAEKASAAGHDVIIASHDKDLLACVSDRVRMLKTSTWEFVGEREVVAKFGVEPAGIRDLLALCGDKSDGIEGAKGVGPVTAKALLLQHFGIDELYARIDALKVGDVLPTKTPEAAKIATPAVLQSLHDNRAKVMLARQLVTLRTDAPVKFDDIYERREPVTTINDDDAINLDAEDDVPISAPPPRPPVASSTETATVVDAEPVPVPETTTSTRETSVSTPPVTSAAPASPVTETALVVADGVELSFERQLEPRSSQGALALGKVLYESRLYSRFPTAAAITAVIMRGRELGIGATAALASFHVVEGAPVASASLLIALAKKHPDCEWFQLQSSSATAATWATKNRRNPKPTSFTYTIEQARAAGLLEKPKSPWNTRPDDMLIKTAGSKLGRIEYPDALLSLYSIEEGGDE